MKFGTFLLLVSLGLGIFSPARAQVSGPYLKAAYFYVSVDDWADMWLNDTPIVDSQRRTAADKGPQKIKALRESLCLFKENNVLAIEVDDSIRPPDPDNDYAGVAYVLELDFSDGTQSLLSSNEPNQHRAYYIPSHQMGNPTGWQRFNFDDGSWTPAQNTGNSIPGLAILNLPSFGGLFQFLSASSLSSKVQSVGEKHLFRRKFSLNISPNPNCENPTRSPRIEPMVVNQPEERHPVTVPPPAPTLTPTSTATYTVPPEVPLAITPTWTPVPKIYPRPTSMVKAYRKVWKSPTPTPTIPFIRQTEGEPAEVAAPLTVVNDTPWTPTATFTVITPTSEGQTIVFDDAPANIYMSFADGPGLYRLELFDKNGRPLKNLFEKNVVAQPDAWAEWDGKDDSGRDAPPGFYYVVFSKGGRELRKLTLLRSGTKN